MKELSFYDNIEEFSSPSFLFNKFKNEDCINLDDCKKAFYFAFGKKIKKKFMINLIKNQNLLSDFNNDNVLLKEEDFKFMFAFFKNNPEMHLNSNHDLILDFYNYLTSSNSKIQYSENFKIPINLLIFKCKIKENFPNLSYSLIEEIFLLLDKDKDGILRLSDFEVFLIY